MLSRLPHEIRLNIFHKVFADFWRRGVIRVKDTAEGIRFAFEDNCDYYRCAGAVSCLDVAIMGEGVAAAAAEALYQSDFTFGVDADFLCTFLQSCPFSHMVQPGRYIKRLDFYMDEDPNFIGDGKTGQDLRKADWVGLVAGPGDDRTTRSTKRTQTMRKCWRAILNMPGLFQFKFLVMPAQGKASADDIIRVEIKDIIPMYHRLRCRRLDPEVYVRAWEICTMTLDQVLDNPRARYGDVYEFKSDISSCIPYMWQQPSAKQRAEADAIAARPGDRPFAFCLASCDYKKLHAVRNYDVLQHYLRKLDADKSEYL